MKLKLQRRKIIVLTRYSYPIERIYKDTRFPIADNFPARVCPAESFQTPEHFGYGVEVSRGFRGKSSTRGDWQILSAVSAPFIGSFFLLFLFQVPTHVNNFNPSPGGRGCIRNRLQAFEQHFARPSPSIRSKREPVPFPVPPFPSIPTRSLPSRSACTYLQALLDYAYRASIYFNEYPLRRSDNRRVGVNERR